MNAESKKKAFLYSLWYYQWICVDKRSGYVFNRIRHHLMCFKFYHILYKSMSRIIIFEITRPVIIIYIWNSYQWKRFCLSTWKTRKVGLWFKTSGEEWVVFPKLRNMHQHVFTLQSYRNNLTTLANLNINWW